MFAGLRDQRWRLGAAALYALAMLLLGFAHMPSAAQGVPQDLSAYALPDGYLPDICLGKDEAPSGTHAPTPVCAACLLTAATGLPPAAAGLAAPVVFSLLPLLPEASAPRGVAPQKAHPARGPPATLA
ncbi:MAG: hypothetical protein AB1592_14860 [Pseudomonadota bacterium]